MHSKKHVQNPQTPIFNIRKVNKKTIGMKNGGEGVYYTPQTEHQKLPDLQNYSSLFQSEALDPRREKEMMLDQTVSEAIINSKVYGDLKRVHIDNKKKNAQHRIILEQNIERKRKQKQEAKKQQQKLQQQKQKYLDAIAQMKSKIEAVRQTNQRYRQALTNRVSGQAEYISNLIMSMRFQAQFEHDIDPDQMTYEELLQLQQKIGVVSKGLPTQLIHQLPKIQVLENSEQKCMVCLSQFQEREVMTKIPSCRHQFHFQCLESWLGKQKICPLCKVQVQFALAE